MASFLYPTLFMKSWSRELWRHELWPDTFPFVNPFQADKVQFLQHIKELPSKEARNAEMALFCGQTNDAEAILLQASLIFRALMLNVHLFNWDR